jgi:transcriptional regulator with XRE-family HTH domain
MNIGKAVRICRAARGLSQRELAEKAEFSSAYISLIEQGKREPSLSGIKKLSNALSLPHDLLILLALEGGETDKASIVKVEELARHFLNLVISAEEQHGKA